MPGPRESKQLSPPTQTCLFTEIIFRALILVLSLSEKPRMKSDSRVEGLLSYGFQNLFSKKVYLVLPCFLLIIPRVGWAVDYVYFLLSHSVFVFLLVMFLL